MISFSQRGDFDSIEKLLKKSIGVNYRSILEEYAKEGVSALAANTPLDSGKTASSWTYSIEQNGSSLSIVWQNTNVNQGVNIALILQYGHATKNGGYVQGIDYINPALRPVFDKLADKAWKAVTSG